VWIMDTKCVERMMSLIITLVYYTKLDVSINPSISDMQVDVECNAIQRSFVLTNLDTKCVDQMV
jgi:hypothetical protein